MSSPEDGPKTQDHSLGQPEGNVGNQSDGDEASPPPQNLQNILVFSRARRALLFATDEDQSSLSLARGGQCSSTSSDK